MNFSKEQFQEMEYTELCVLVEEGKITWSEWVDAQPDLYEGYDEWLINQGLERNDENAHRYMHMVEEQDMLSQHSDAMNENIATLNKARRVLQDHD